MNLAIVGATGNVGRKILEVLEKKNFPIDNLYFVASSKSAGSKLKFKGNEIEVKNLENFDFSKANITFFSAGGKISEQYVPTAAQESIVIDNSSFFRMDPDVPLIVPQVNSNDIKNMKKNIIANPNCSTAQLVIILKPLHDLFKIKRVIISTYQSTSGAGKAPMDELLEQTKLSLGNKKIVSKNFTKQIAFNAIPHIDTFADEGYTKEELKMVNETKKILDKNIEITRNALNSAEGCEVVDERKDEGYITPLEAEGKNETFISRIRKDNSNNKAVNLWCVSDNLLRGAALNAVEIAEAYIKNK